MKKLLVLGLAAGVGASTLTGCFGKKTSVPSGWKKLNITWATPNMEFWNSAAITSGAAFKKAGVAMKHTPIEFTTLTEYMDPAHNNTDFQLFSLAVTEAQFPDPYGYFHTDNNKEGGMNTSRVDANSALGIQTDEKIDAVRAAETADEYRAAYREYLKFMNKEMTILPMYANDYHDLFRSDVDNFKTPADVNWATDPFAPGTSTYHKPVIAVMKGANIDGGDTTLNLQNDGLERVFNPHYYSIAYDGNVIDMMFERTAYIAGDNVQTSGVLDIENTTIDDDGYTIYNMQSGTKLSAHDVAFSFLVAAAPEYSGRYENKFISYIDAIRFDDAAKTFSIKWKENKYLNSSMLNEFVMDAEAVDSTFAAKVATYTANTPITAGAENKVSGWVNSAAYKAFGTGASLKDWNSIATGAYDIHEDLGVKTAIRMQLSSDYASGDAYPYNPVQKQVLLREWSKDLELDGFLAGDIHVLPGTVQGEHIEKALAANHKFNNYDRNGYGYTRFRTDYAPFKDNRVRQAIAHIIDRDEFLETEFPKKGGGYYASYHDAPYAQPNGFAAGISEEEGWISYGGKDGITKATELLTEAGLKMYNGWWYYDSAVFK